MSETIDDGLDFNGWIKPPDVPPDPVGDEWRGPPGPPGAPGPAGAPGAGALSVLNYLPAGQPDGTTDNASGINNALAAAAATGAQLIFPVTAHNYMVHGLSVPSNSHLIVQGTLQLMAGQTGYILVHAPNAKNVVIEGTGTLDGNKANQTAAASGGIGGDGGTNITVRNLTITNCYNWPLNLTNTTHGRVEDVTMTNSGNSCEFAINCQDCWFRNCFVSNINDLGLGFYGGGTNCGVVNCTVTGCHGAGVFILQDNAQPAASSDILLQGNVCYNNPAPGIIVTSNSSTPTAHTNITVTDNICYGNQNQGILIGDVIGLLVQGNFCRSNLYGGSPTVAGDIMLSNTVSTAKVSGNILINCQAGGTVGFGIYLGTPSDIQVSDNYFEDGQATKSMAGAIGGQTGLRNTISGNHYGLLIGTPDQLTYGSGSIQGISTDAANNQMIGTFRLTINGTNAWVVNATHTQPTADYQYQIFNNEVVYTANGTGGDSLGLVSYMTVRANGHTVGATASQHTAAIYGNAYMEADGNAASAVDTVNGGMFVAGNGGPGTMTNAIDIRGHEDYNTGGGHITNHYFLYQAPSTAATNEYGAYFSAPIGIGSTAPAYNIDINMAGGGNVNYTNGMRIDFSDYGSLFITRNGHSIYPGYNPGKGGLGVMDLVVGFNGAANALNATNGFLYISSCAGTPTGVPVASAIGRIPITIDTNANKLWAYVNGAWKGVVLT
jgi:hypothetical protein